MSETKPMDPRGAAAPRLTGAQLRAARTRARMLHAAREILTDGPREVSIQEITERAGVGFGSFFNHFPGGKDQLFTDAVLQLLDAYAAWLGAAVEDAAPASAVERVALSFRLTGRLVVRDPAILAPLLSAGAPSLFADNAMRTAVESDLRAGIDIGDFVPLDIEVHVVALGGVLLGLIRLLTHEDATRRPLGDPADVIDGLARGVLRMLGVPDDRAAEACAAPLPDLPPLGLIERSLTV